MSIFERIVAGEIPCTKIFEDEHTLAFLDIHPLSEGHTLLIPKRCWRQLDDVPPEVAAALGAALAKVGAAVAKGTGCAGWNVLQNNGASAGQEVPHVHFHIIPRADGDGLGFRWKPKALSSAEAERLGEAIRGAMA